MKRVCILGSTGSIGTQALKVIKDLKNIKVVALSADKNISLLEKQIKVFNPLIVAVTNEEKFFILEKKLKNTETKVLFGIDGLIEIAKMQNYDMLLNSLVGNIGLLPTITAIESGKDIALANKETLVTAGEIIMPLAKEKNVKIYPIDSEHSAIFQCLEGSKDNLAEKILLTASGGPFRGKDKVFLSNVTVEDALAHPNWSMGSKITIDSATLMNKGLELIEAKWLFDIPAKDIEVIVHPQSIIHSMVQFKDSSVIAQLGEADMKVPISYALTYPKRVQNNYKRLDFFELKNLTFEKPDLETFPCLRLAKEAINLGGTAPTVLNAANEVAVNLFLEKKISFLKIPKLIETAVNAYTVKYNFDINDILEIDKLTRAYVKEIYNK